MDRLTLWKLHNKLIKMGYRPKKRFLENTEKFITRIMFSIKNPTEAQITATFYKR